MDIFRDSVMAGEEGLLRELRRPNIGTANPPKLAKEDGWGGRSAARASQTEHWNCKSSEACGESLGILTRFEFMAA